MVEMQGASDRILPQRTRDLIEALCRACLEFGGAKVLPHVGLARFAKARRVHALTPQHASGAYATLPPTFVHGNLSALLPARTRIEVRVLIRRFGKCGQRFAFGHGRGRSRDVDRIGRQAFGGDFKRGARARRGFKEEIDDRLAAQRRHFLDRALVDLFERFSRIEDGGDLLDR